MSGDSFPMPEHGFTCFHCGDTFTTPGSARDHFGFDPSADPACRIKLGGERGLVMELRKAEREIAELWGRIHAESTEAVKAMASMAGRHQRQIVDAEQAGYDRGLAHHAAEIDRLRQIVRLYGIKVAMANAPADLKISIDEAMKGIGE